MRLMVFIAVLSFLCSGLPGADTNPYLKLSPVIKNGTLRISIKNISHKPIVAYVVAVQDSGRSATHHGVYTGPDAFAAGKTIEVSLDVHSVSASSKIFVDYVRLADSSSWGDPVTQDGKEVAARFQR